MINYCTVIVLVQYSGSVHLCCSSTVTWVRSVNVPGAADVPPGRIQCVWGEHRAAEQNTQRSNQKLHLGSDVNQSAVSARLSTSIPSLVDPESSCGSNPGFLFPFPEEVRATSFYSARQKLFKDGWTLTHKTCHTHTLVWTIPRICWPSARMWWRSECWSPSGHQGFQHLFNFF